MSLKTVNQRQIAEYARLGTRAVRPVLDKLAAESQVLVLTPRNIQVSLDRRDASEKIGNPGLKGLDIKSQMSKAKRYIKELYSTEKTIASSGKNKEIASGIFKIISKEARNLQDQGSLSIVTANARKIQIAASFRTLQKVKTRLLEALNTVDKKTKYLSEAQNFLKNTQIGHAQGVIAEIADSILALTSDSPETYNFIRDLSQTIIIVEGNARYLREVNRRGANIKVLHTLEFSFYNSRMGNIARVFSNKLRMELRKAIGKGLIASSPELEKVYADLISAKGSPSLEDMIRAFMEGSFKLDKKPKPSKRLSNAKAKSDSKSPINVKSKTRAPVKRRKTMSKDSSTGMLGGLLHLQSIINLKLHDTLKNEVMGQGEDPVALNYRTGRFARSAHLNQLIPMKGGLEAQITWQRYPYDTFAPGGKLHTPMRDPNFLIGQSIREILKEIGLQSIMISTRSQ